MMNSYSHTISHSFMRERTMMISYSHTTYLTHYQEINLRSAFIEQTEYFGHSPRSDTRQLIELSVLIQTVPDVRRSDHCEGLQRERKR